MKKIILAAMAIASLLATAGCATPPSSEDLAKKAAVQAEVNRTVPICVNEKDCNAKWEAAQLWVIHNAGYKIQTSTNVLIETYSAVGVYACDNLLSVRVTKEPIGGGRYALPINIWGACAPRWSTPADPLAAALDFNRTVGAATNGEQANVPSQDGKLRFGVTVVDVTPSFAALLNRPNLKGVVIGTVNTGSVADKAGIKVGDVLVEYDGHIATSEKDVRAAIAATPAGKTVSVKVLRAVSADLQELKELTLNASF